MKKMTKALAAIMLTVATLFVAGCEREDSIQPIVEGTEFWVDLGLPSGLQWATCNVGASSPEDYGDYFAWGETTPKSIYNWSTYCYCNGGNDQLTKYCFLSSYGYNGFTDGLTILQPEDDAATANYGGRTPTLEEWQELIDNTTVEWTVLNEVGGCRFSGSNGNSIFLPAAGDRMHNTLHAVDMSGLYWLNSIDSQNIYSPDAACSFDFNAAGCGIGYSNRSMGFSVRAVRQN